MKEFLLFEKLRQLYKILPLGEFARKLNCDCTCLSKFSYNKHSFVLVLELWAEVWIFAFNKTVKSLILSHRNVFSLSASASYAFKISFSTNKSFSHIISERSLLTFVFGSVHLVWRFRKSLVSLICWISVAKRSLIFAVSLIFDLLYMETYATTMEIFKLL